jgi:deazaflavin-dependent oxidoreductase (nitroreductase family)
MAKVQDSPTDFVKEHIDRYVASNGEDGYEFHGAVTLLLTTIGRKSGIGRRTGLIYRQHGDDYVVVASKGGAPEHPAWYLNLKENPEVTVQVKADVFQARAREATDAEYPELWALLAENWPAYNEYQTKTTRKIPIVVLERS